MKKHLRIKNKIKILFSILIIILLSTIIILKVYKNYNKTNNNKEETKETSNMTINALKGLKYSNDDIDILKKYVSEDNIKILINKIYDKDIVMKIVKEDYYIDDYFDKYISYYLNHKDYETDIIIRNINTHIDNKFYTNTYDTDTSLGKYVLLNKYYKAENTYKGENLIDIDPKYSLYGNTYETKLSKECYEAFIKMYEAALSEGYEFKINSAYRSFEKQEKIYNNYVAKDGQEQADTYSARPGYSEHQTGFAFDLRDYPLSTDDFSKTKEFTWMQNNAYKYGFILRFPKDKENITGYQYESWHYRYCGDECSNYIHNHNITFEEYYEYFIKYNNPKNLK